MNQFDLCRNLAPDSRTRIPYFLILRAEILRDLDPVVVAPVWPAERFQPPLRTLHLAVALEDRQFVVQINGLLAVPKRLLGESAGSLEERRSEIIGALDFLFTGF